MVNFKILATIRRENQVKNKVMILADGEKNIEWLKQSITRDYCQNGKALNK